MRFSKELIDRTKAYLGKKSGTELTDAEANEYLQRLGELGLVVCDLFAARRSAAPRVSAGAAGCVAPAEPSVAVGRRSGGTELVSQYPQTPVVGDG
jgi:hypothetical protein